MIWAAWVLGLLSISTANPQLLIGWFIGQTVEFGVAGSGLASARLLRLSLQVLIFFIVCIGATILLQSLGFAPAIHGT